MAIAYMSRVTIPQYDNRIDQHGFEYEETLSVVGNGDTIIVPDSVNNISVTVDIIGVGSRGAVQTTTNKLQDVLDDNNVVWVTWAEATVLADTQDSLVPVTALRLVNVAGTVRIMIRAQ